MIQSFWRNATASTSKRLLVLGGILTVTSSKSHLEQCQLQRNPLMNPQVKNMTSIKNLKQRMTEWSFAEEQTLLSLPIEEEKRNFVRRDVPRVIFSEVYPTPFQNKPSLVCASSDALANLLDMDPKTMPEDEDFVEWVAGNKVIKGSIPLAHRYGGYQFGYWADQLGDGRAILLGEYLSESGQRLELQLKGAGKTPYSRFGDGRAVLRSSIREFLCSEAMFALDHTRLFCEKLGLTFDVNNMADDQELIELLHKSFFASSADFTQAFRDMSETEIDSWLTTDDKWGLKKLNRVKRFQDFVEQYRLRLSQENLTDEQRMKRMCDTNPRYILRNWIAQQAIEKAEKGDFSEVKLLYEVLSTPYVKQDKAEQAGYANPVPEWSKELVVSCSS